MPRSLRRGRGPSGGRAGGQAAALDGLLAEQGIHAVAPGPVPFQPVLDDVRVRIHANEAQQAVVTNNPPSIRYDGPSGQGVVLQVSESVWDGHPDFLTSTGASRFVNPSPTSGGFHGTHVAGIIGGGGVHSASLALQNSPWYSPIGTWRGIAPEATLYDSSYSGNTPLIDASNHSYVMTYGDYSSTASAHDRSVRGDNGRQQQWPRIWAAANQGGGAQYDNEEGYYSMYAPAKNVISVGSVNSNDGGLSGFSRQPRPDLRRPHQARRHGPRRHQHPAGRFRCLDAEGQRGHRLHPRHQQGHRGHRQAMGVQRQRRHRGLVR